MLSGKHKLSMKIKGVYFYFEFEVDYSYCVLVATSLTPLADASCLYTCLRKFEKGDFMLVLNYCVRRQSGVRAFIAMGMLTSAI